MRTGNNSAAFMLLVLVQAFSAHARAEARKELRDSETVAQDFQEIERGFWVRSILGISVTTQNPYKDKSRKNPAWPPGGTIGLELGLDLGQMASVHLAACGLHLNGTMSTAQGKTNVANDVGALLVMAGLRFNFATTKRIAWFVKTGAGYLVARPKQATLDDGMVVQAGAGFEYATNLRHFFVGLEAGSSYFLGSDGLVSTVTPTLKYTF